MRREVRGRGGDGQGWHDGAHLWVVTFEDEEKDGFFRFSKNDVSDGVATSNLSDRGTLCISRGPTRASRRQRRRSD